MDHIVIKVRTIFLLILFFNINIFAQNTPKGSKFLLLEKSATSDYAYFSDLKYKGRQHSYSDLEVDLSTNIPIPSNIECKFLTEIFIFRVNKKGEIDFVKSNGNLEDSSRIKIIQNIKNTKGHWYISKNTNKTFHYFVFPFYSHNIDPLKKCSSGAEFYEINALIKQYIDIKRLLMDLLPPSVNITFLSGGSHYKGLQNLK